MGSQNIGIFRIQFDFFGGTNINLSKIILIDITIFQDRSFLEQAGTTQKSSDLSVLSLYRTQTTQY